MPQKRVTMEVVHSGHQQAGYQFDLSGGALCLDFANTVSHRHLPQRRAEHLDTYADLVAFADQSKLLPPPWPSRIPGPGANSSAWLSGCCARPNPKRLPAPWSGWSSARKTGARTTAFSPKLTGTVKTPSCPSSARPWPVAPAAGSASTPARTTRWCAKPAEKSPASLTPATH